MKRLGLLGLAFALLAGPAFAQFHGGGSGGSASGVSGAVQAANGSGGFLDTGLTAASGEIKGKFSYSITTNGSNTITGTIDADTAPTPSPTMFNRTSTANVYTGSACTPTDYVNHVVGMGHNLAGNHTRVNASYAASLLGFESNYCVGTRKELEFYYRVVDTGGTVRQPFGTNVEQDGSYGDISLQASVYAIHSLVGTPILWQKWDYSKTNPLLDLYTHNGTATGNYQIVRQQRNNAAWLQQNNAAGSDYLNLPYFDGQDNRQMGSTAGVYWNVQRHGTGAVDPEVAIGMSVSSTGVAAGDKAFFVQLPTSANSYYGWQMSGSFADNLYNIISNTNNATGNAHTKFSITTGGSAAGDPTFGTHITGAIHSYHGIDNSDNDAWKINANATDSNLGTGDIFRIETTGAQKGQIAVTAVTFANLGAPANGTMAYCSDCDATCAAGASTGQFCKRLNGAWSAM